MEGRSGARARTGNGDGGTAIDRLVGRFRSDVGGSPALAALTVAAALGTLWATAAGPLPGTKLIDLAPIAASLPILCGWLGLHALLLRCYRRAARPERRATILPRLVLAQLALVAASVPAAFPVELVVFRAPYAKYLWLLAVAAGAAAVLLGEETRRLASAVLARRAGRVAAGAVATLVCAAYAVGAVDLLLHVDGRWEYKYQLRYGAFAANVATLAAVHAVLFAITARLRAALLLGTGFYAALGAATLGKVTYMHAAVHPLDLLYLAELAPQLGRTFGPLGSGAVVVAGVALSWAVAAALRRPARVRWRSRAATIAIALPILLVPGLAQRFEPLGRALLAGGIEPKGWDSVLSVRQNGVLVELLSYLPDIGIEAPAHYSPQAVREVLGRYDWQRPALAESPRPPPTLIVYMIESLMDPTALGWTLDADPIPTIRALAAAHTSGRAIVPGRFGESASSEFELLTGMSTTFLPERSVAYKQYIKRDLPSLPCMLRELGYETVAIQADPIAFYNRREVYERLCFERTLWLFEDETVPRAANGKAPADAALVDALIAEASVEGPAFVFAFPSSTHHPYNSAAVAAGGIRVLDAPTASTRTELEHYLSSVRDADAAVAKLIAHFHASDRDVVIAVLGDHLPPLSAEALGAFYRGVEEADIARAIRERSVPLVVWSNLDFPREELSIGLNFLGSYLLRAAGIEARGFFRFVSGASTRLNALSRRIVLANGAPFAADTAPPAYRTLVEDYRLLQHDMLFGERHLATALDGLGMAVAGAP